MQIEYWMGKATLRQWIKHSNLDTPFWHSKGDTDQVFSFFFSRNFLQFSLLICYMYKIHVTHVFLVFMQIHCLKISITRLGNNITQPAHQLYLEILGRVLLDFNHWFSRINYHPKKSGLDPYSKLNWGTKHNSGPIKPPYTPSWIEVWDLI